MSSSSQFLNSVNKSFLVFFMPKDEWHMQEHSGIYSELEIVEIAKRMIIDSPELADQFLVEEKGFKEACRLFRDSGFFIIDLNKISQRKKMNA